MAAMESNQLTNPLRRFIRIFWRLAAIFMLVGLGGLLLMGQGFYGSKRDPTGQELAGVLIAIVPTAGGCRARNIENHLFFLINTFLYLLEVSSHWVN